MDKRLSILLFCYVIFFQGCYSYKYEQLTYYKKYRDKGEIRLNGFYFCDDTVTDKGFIIDTRSTVFYADGTYTDAVGDLRNPKASELFFKNSGRTGPFVIDSDTIRCQSFYNTSESWFSGTMVVWESVVHIVNDTTLDFIEKGRRNKKWRYRFIQFDNKPDSSKAWFKSGRKLRKLDYD